MDWTTPERFMLVFLSTPSARRATQAQQEADHE